MNDFPRCRIQRFPGPPQGSWSSGHEALAFQVDRRCQISGFGLYGHPDKDINVTIKILEGTSRDGSICLGEKTTEYKVTSKVDPAEVLFDTPITVESGKDYCMVAHVKTSVSILRGSNGKGRVTGGGITFTFKNASGSNNGNSATSGQFPFIICGGKQKMPLVRWQVDKEETSCLPDSIVKKVSTPLSKIQLDERIQPFFGSLDKVE